MLLENDACLRQHSFRDEPAINHQASLCVRHCVVGVFDLQPGVVEVGLGEFWPFVAVVFAGEF